MTHDLLPIMKPHELKETDAGHDWLIENLWASAAVGVIGGSPKSCKSWLGLDMALSVATGTPCLDACKVHKKGTALIYLAEDANYIVRQRLDALCQHRRLDLKQLDLLVITTPTLRLDSDAHIQRLTNTIEQLKPRLLLLDPLVRLHRCDENNAQEIAAILDKLRTIQRVYNIAIVLVHHARKNQSKTQPGQALRGSSDLWAWGDSNLYLAKEQKHLRLIIEHRAAPPPEPIKLSLALHPPHLEIISETATAQPTLEQRIITTLNENNTPYTKAALRKMLAVNNNAIGKTLASLQQKGSIRHTENGWISLYKQTGLCS